MEAAEFIRLATQGDVHVACAEVQRDPELSRARDAQGVSVLCLAVYRRRTELVAALTAARKDLDIFEAACVGDLARVVRLVSDEPGRVNSLSPDGFSPVGFSAFFGHSNLLRELLRRGGAVNAPSRNAMRVCPLHSAAAHSDQTKAVELARILLEAGADPNAQQQGGFVALHEAALNGNIPLIELLLEYGAEPSIRDEKGATPADLARSKGQADALRWL
ncbi:MAG TPA: ankyrin repeat domain-containing protein [Polyangiales bacterium]|nr:ankyrin repeat domain-containing protein [Polyangiales bacterium]